WLILFGFIGYYLASYFDFLGLIYIKASLERLILFIYPTLVLLISFVFLRKKITSKQVIGVVVTYLGVFIIFVSELSISDDSSVIWGSILIFLSALTYASYLVGSGWLIPKFGATAFTSYAMIVSCMAVILHYSLQRPEGLLNFQPEVYWIGLAMAVFATVIPSYLVSFAIKILGASDFSIFGSLGPISTIGLAYLFLSETLTWTQFLGAGVIIGGIVLAEKKKTGLKK
ncbi:MAG: DMT family transporter, partial [Marinoscillum sp.]